jgi:hypothetical protein
MLPVGPLALVDSPVVNDKSEELEDSELEDSELDPDV